MANIDKNFFDKPHDFNLKDEIYRYLFFWKWFVLAVLVSVVMVYFYLRKSPNIYNTEAVIQIVDPSSGIELPSASFVFNRSSINLENETNIIKSYSIVESVVKKLNLNYSFFLEGTIKTAQLSRFPLGFKYRTSLESHQYGRYKVSFLDKVMQITTNKGEVLNFDSYNADSHEDLPFDIFHAMESKGLVKDKTYIINVSPVKSTVISLKNRLEISQVGKQSP